MLDLSPLDSPVGTELAIVAAGTLVLLAVALYLLFSVGKAAAVSLGLFALLAAGLTTASWAAPATAETVSERDRIVETAKEEIKADLLDGYNIQAVTPADGEWDARLIKAAATSTFADAPQVDVLLTDGRWVTFGVQYNPKTADARLIADARQRVITPAELERPITPTPAADSFPDGVDPIEVQPSDAR